MVTTTVTPTTAHRRRTERLVAAALSGIVALIYLALIFLVRDAEQAANVVTDTTWGAYLFLTVPYAVGAVLLLVTDRRALWIVGAVVQLAVLALFVVFAVGLGLGPDNTGVFAYDALSDLPMELIATVVTGLQVVLLGLLVHLSLRPPTQSVPDESGQLA